MLRTQIQLREDQSKKLKEMAAQYDVSVAELIRQSVDLLLQSNEPSPAELWERTHAVRGKYRSGVTDLAVNHDNYLAEIYAEIK